MNITLDSKITNLSYKILPTLDPTSTSHANRYSNFTPKKKKKKKRLLRQIDVIYEGYELKAGKSKHQFVNYQS